MVQRDPETCNKLFVMTKGSNKVKVENDQDKIPTLKIEVGKPYIDNQVLILSKHIVSRANSV